MFNKSAKKWFFCNKCKKM